VIGGQNSGKSQFAEELVVNSGTDRRYYLATMKVCDEAGEERIIKHRKQREGKGFITLEIPYAIDKAAYLMEEPEHSIVLLECIANLVGNELYDNPERIWYKDRCGDDDQGGNKGSGYFSDRADYDMFADTIMKDICTLSDSVRELIIVTNEYDIEEYVHESTRMYIELINRVNERLYSFADKIYRI
jgi:adenosylcobinamide kinase/adenosylcobinamide-phosphate guanylyltransferase